MSEMETGIRTEIETEVVVVGAGPTGLMLACELALAGVDAVVLERLSARVEQVKGGAIQPRSAELLDQRGLLEALLARVIPRDAVGGHFATLPVPLDATVWNTRHPYPIGVPQWVIEEMLEERASAGGVRVLRERGVLAVEADADGVTVDAAGGLRVRSRYLVACDGGHSTVRKLLGLPFPGQPGTRPAVLTDISLSAVSSLVPQQAGHISTLMRHTEDYWSMLVPVGGDRYRFTFGPLLQSSEERDTPVTREEIAAALEAVYGPETVLSAVENASRFTDATRQVEQYRVGRVLFAGDAAHIHPPLGGQGLNLGVQDALNLGWKLAATLQDRAPEGLLDSYHTERHPVGAQVLRHTSAQRVLAELNPSHDVAALREIFIDLLRLPDANRYLAGLMSGLSLHYDLPGEHRLVGQLMPDAELVTDADSVYLSALQRTGHAIVLDLAKAVPDDFALPPRVDLVRAASVEDLGAAVVLIRPDGYVCWATDSPADCRDALRAAIAGSVAKAG
ncbi:monooxygenase FAD-binding [Catenulispora acidiphila DSM 44928]|uniref:Monooxygenase FAD-binding n=1 Tax=Catenulispora acidiphila (strain DSM 44928 / JCM 14897 / NBRC 102108 / NRRL B-24433 / ID139908) TaxID=479433 RepID=C7Q997_CATAD|nr:FAD-dependent monooxygenase [Catenulispora acidiphila]ACU74243.1 monooxygenase FAD-binding [Catenulispora acidiphila DSM 44928]